MIYDGLASNTALVCQLKTLSSEVLVECSVQEKFFSAEVWFLFR